MAISALEIADFRNLCRISLSCSPRLNLIIGANASGKTSVLEAIYFLARARSFRTAQPQELIRRGAAALRVVARISAGGRELPLGIEHSAQAITVRIDGSPVQSLAELARQLPVLLLDSASHRLLEDGPQYRRRFIDWGVFHRENNFLAIWKRYRAALKQRNAVLKNAGSGRELESWERELDNAAVMLDPLRKYFCEALESALEPLIDVTLGVRAPRIEYRRGWAQERSLLELLRRDREQDRRHGYTRLGPHRADFTLRLQDQPAEQLSRGQQKLLVMALVLAQARLYRARCGAPCVLLIDDLPAELDQPHRERVMACLAAQDSQLFITALEPQALVTTAWAGADQHIFQLTHGAINAMV